MPFNRKGKLNAIKAIYMALIKHNVSPPDGLAEYFVWVDNLNNDCLLKHYWEVVKGTRDRGLM